MRVISGTARGTSLSAVPGMHTRPTTDRVKESIFSIIQLYIPQSLVLDLFAGSGALGIEALSRGARRCVFVENDRQAMATVQKNLAKTRLADRAFPYYGSHIQYLSAASEPFDVVLLDPPYQKGLCTASMELIHARGLLRAGGVIVCETEAAEVLNTPFRLKKDYRYGKTKISVFIKDDAYA